MGAWLLALVIVSAAVAACDRDEVPELRGDAQTRAISTARGDEPQNEQAQPNPAVVSPVDSQQDDHVEPLLADVRQQQLSGDQGVAPDIPVTSPPPNDAQVTVASANVPPVATAPYDAATLTALANLAQKDSRLMLSTLTVTTGATRQQVFPTFSSLRYSYTIPVPSSVEEVSITGVAARPGLATLEYRSRGGDSFTVADADTPSLQLLLPDVGVRQVDIVVNHGAESATYRLRIVRAGAPDAEAPCAAANSNDPEPLPATIEEASIPITVKSNTSQYFVLYVRDQADSDQETPVALTLGRPGTTILAEPLTTLPVDRYRIEQYFVADPADIDGDCIDDITELADPARMNPLNPAPIIESSDGVTSLPDRATFDALSYRKDQSPDDFAYVKFVLLDMDTDRPRVYFINSEQHRYHVTFREALGLEPTGAGTLSGTIVHHPNRVARNGAAADYHFEFWPFTHYRFDVVAHAQTVLAASMPLLEDNLVYYVPKIAIPAHEREAASYRDSRVGIVFDENVLPERGFVSLNAADGFGRLRIMAPGERPNPRDIVIYEALPNELPRVAGIITTVPQTPLSHVNLRAVQDGVPNAFIHAALDVTDIGDFVDKYVRYSVTDDGWSMREASRAEVDGFYASSRPANEQTPQRDLSVTSITALSEIKFDDWTAFGVKAANLAVLGRLSFPTGTIPDGFAVPFHFYDEFMKHNGFYTEIKSMLADPEFQSDLGVQEEQLNDLRQLIRGAPMPRWIMDDLAELQASFPEGTSIRCRSSTNNEDLPGFSGAGLYDSRTQHPDEGHIAKCIKQVYASLWNFRAFVERDFHRVNHLATAMAVLTHPNYSEELANGVAVSFDPVNGDPDAYYVNVQVGEDLVTNPLALSVPEEILLRRDGEATILASSNQAAEGDQIMSSDHLAQLREYLTVIHEHFRSLYNPGSGEPFAIEVEFKITSDNILAIKQARPWIFHDASSVSPTRTLDLP